MSGPNSELNSTLTSTLTIRDDNATAEDKAGRLEKGVVEVKAKNSAEVASEDEDEAMAAMRAYGGPPIVMDDATNKRLLRTIDWHLMPVSYRPRPCVHSIQSSIDPFALTRACRSCVPSTP